MTLDELHDRTLVNRARAGEVAAFDELVRKCDRPLVELAGRLLDERSDAEDVRQLAWIRVWQGLADFDERARFTTWAFRIVVNLCRDRRRERARREARLDGALRGESVATDELEPAEALARAELAACVRAALASLPADERECLVLRHYHDLPAAEIGAVVGRPRTTVQSCLARALTRLQLKLRPLFHDERPDESRNEPRDERDDRRARRAAAAVPTPLQRDEP